MGYYKNAQICLNGHIISRDVSNSVAEKFCSKCGAETITSCIECQTAIRGKYHVDGIVDLTSHREPAPAYCFNCGHAFPWTEDALEATRMLIDEEDELSNEEKEKLKQTLPDILSETPRTALAVNRIKKACMKAGGFLKEGLMQFVATFACELAKQQLGL